MGDRLFSAFGQDTIDALFWTATEPRDRKREHIGVIPHFLLTITYVILHTLLVLLQATTLNVAINAKDLTDAAEREDFLSRARALEEEAGRREAAVLALVRAAVD